VFHKWDRQNLTAYHISISEVIKMGKLKIVSMVRINGEKVRQEDIPPDEFKALVEKAIVRAMNNIGFERVETA
jgi:hypothetical protein